MCTKQRSILFCLQLSNLAIWASYAFLTQPCLDYRRDESDWCKTVFCIGQVLNWFLSLLSVILCIAETQLINLASVTHIRKNNYCISTSLLQCSLMLEGKGIVIMVISSSWERLSPVFPIRIPIENWRAGNAGCGCPSCTRQTQRWCWRWCCHRTWCWRGPCTGSRLQ